MQYEIPFLHPFAVHFPVALIVVAAVAALWWAARGQTFWRRATLFLMVCATVGTAFAYFTGEALEEAVEGDPIVEELGERHEELALYGLLGGLGLTAAFAGVTFWLERRTTLERNPADPLALRVGLALLVVGLAALILWTAWLGGVMVWGVAG